MVVDVQLFEGIVVFIVDFVVVVVVVDVVVAWQRQWPPQQQRTLWQRLRRQ